MSKLSQVIEALLFASDEPLTLRRLKNILSDFEVREAAPAAETQESPVEAAVETVTAAEEAPAAEAQAEAVVEGETQTEEAEEPAPKPTKLDDEIRQAIADLKAKYSSEDSPVVVLELAEGWQLASNPVYGQWVKKLFKNRMSFRLSQAALETLAIVAYRQPITRAEVEHIRGVEVIASLETLIERGLLKVAGRKETVGRPILYATSPEFLRQFGLRSLQDLPPLSEQQEETAATLVPQETQPEAVPSAELEPVGAAAASEPAPETPES